MEIDELIRWALHISRPDAVPTRTVFERVRTGRPVEFGEVERRLRVVAEPVRRFDGGEWQVVGWRERETPDG